MKKFIGTIQIDNNVIIADPCYEPDNIFVVCEAEAKKGIWRVGVDYEEKNKDIKSIEMLHENAGECKDIRWEHLGNIVVDSGQAGFFDSEYFRKNQPDNEWEKKVGTNWYRRISDMTIENRFGCVDDRCFVSDSNDDGFYEVFYKEDSLHNTIGIKLIFKE